MVRSLVLLVGCDDDDSAMDTQESAIVPAAAETTEDMVEQEAYIPDDRNQEDMPIKHPRPLSARTWCSSMIGSIASQPESEPEEDSDAPYIYDGHTMYQTPTTRQGVNDDRQSVTNSWNYSDTMTLLDRLPEQPASVMQSKRQLKPRPITPSRASSRRMWKAVSGMSRWHDERDLPPLYPAIAVTTITTPPTFDTPDIDLTTQGYPSLDTSQRSDHDSLREFKEELESYIAEQKRMSLQQTNIPNGISSQLGSTSVKANQTPKKTRTCVIQ